MILLTAMALLANPNLSEIGSSDSPVNTHRQRIQQELKQLKDSRKDPYSQVFNQPINYRALNDNLRVMSTQVSDQTDLHNLNISIESNLSSDTHRKSHFGSIPSSYFTLQAELKLKTEVDQPIAEKLGLNNIRGQVLAKKSPSWWWGGLLSKDEAKLYLHADFSPMEFLEKFMGGKLTKRVCKNPKVLILLPDMTKQTRDTLVKMAKHFCETADIIDSKPEFIDFVNRARPNIMELNRLALQLVDPVIEQLDGAFKTAAELLRDYEITVKNCPRRSRKCVPSLTLVARKDVYVADFFAQASLSNEGLVLAGNASTLNLAAEWYSEDYDRDAIILAGYGAFKAVEVLNREEMEQQSKVISKFINRFLKKAKRILIQKPAKKKRRSTPPRIS